MNNAVLKDIYQVLITVTLYMMGDEIGLDKTMAFVVLVAMNTLAWVTLRVQYGTTISRIINKQLKELLVVIALIFAVRIVAKAMQVENITLLLYWAFVARQIFFLLYLAKRIFDEDSMDEGKRINNMIFGKIFKVFIELFNLNPDVRNFDDPLDGITSHNHHRRDYTENSHVDHPRNNENYHGGQDDPQGGE